MTRQAARPDDAVDIDVERVGDRPGDTFVGRVGIRVILDVADGVRVDVREFSQLLLGQSDTLSSLPKGTSCGNERVGHDQPSCKVRYTVYRFALYNLCFILSIASPPFGGKPQQ